MSNRIKLTKSVLVAALAIFGGSLVAQAMPWYAEGLQKLGFTVFKKLEKADDVELLSLGGESSRLSDQQGKVVILNFWATWCPPCRAEMPSMDRLWNKNKDMPFTILGVSVGEDPTLVKDFIAKYNYGYPIFVDPSGKLGAMFGARSIPTTYILDKAGNVIAGKVGGAAYDSAEAVALFAAPREAMSEVGVLAAAAAGLLSFLSPCVLPLIPAYLSMLSGYGLADIRTGSARHRVLARTLAFVAGFALVFTVLGLVFSGASMLLGGLSRTITLIAGILVAVLGLNLVFDFIKVLDLEARFHAVKAPKGYAGAFLIGVAFAAGWSPCVGPVLASILLFAAQEGSLLRSTLLLLAYSTGLALPFIAAGLFFDRLTPLMSWFKRHAQGVRVVSGLLLVALGAFMALGRLSSLSPLAFRAGDALRATAEASPAFVAGLSAGLWALVAAAVLALPAILRRKGPGLLRAIIGAVFIALAFGDLFGFWSTARILAGWLSFQGS